MADSEVWTRPVIKSDGNAHDAHVLLYTENLLVVIESSESVLRDELGNHFELKQESIGPPKFYLDGYIRKATLDNGVDAWALSSSQHVNAEVHKVEDHLKKLRLKLPSKAETPLQV